MEDVSGSGPPSRPWEALEGLEVVSPCEHDLKLRDRKEAGVPRRGVPSPPWRSRALEEVYEARPLSAELRGCVVTRVHEVNVV